jgi:UMF1 family MFS transporter
VTDRLPSSPEAALGDQVTVTQTPSTFAGAWRLVSCEAGRVSCLLIVETFVFVPYVASTMVDDLPAAQIVLALCCTASGVFAAATSPLLCMVLRTAGSRSWALAAVTALLSMLLLTLWWVRPDGGLDSTVAFVVVGLVNMLCVYRLVIEATIGSELLEHWGELRADLNGAAVGNVVSAAMLLALLWAFVWPGTVAWPFVPAQPLFGLNTLLYEPERASGPLMAATISLSALPLVFWRQRSAHPQSAASNQIDFVRDVSDLIQRYRGDRGVIYWVLGRAALMGGLMTLILFGGIYASSDLKLSMATRYLTGAVILAGAGLGLVAHRALNQRLGPRATLRIELACVAAWTVVQLGQSFLLMVLPKGIVVSILMALAFLGSAALLGASASGPREPMDQTVPEDSRRAGAPVLLASMTSWVGPLLVAIFTTLFRSVAAGLVPVLVMIGVGFTALWLANAPIERAPTA